MKLLIVVYHEELERQVMKIVNEELPVPRFTQLDSVIGAGSMSWQQEVSAPVLKRNRLVLIVQDDQMIRDLMGRFRQLRESTGGLRAFIVPVEEVV